MLTSNQRKALITKFGAGTLLITNGGPWQAASDDIKHQCLTVALTGPNTEEIYKAVSEGRAVTFKDADLGINIHWVPYTAH